METERPAGNIIALDYGRRRVGVAGCQPEIGIAFGLTTLEIDDLTDLMGQLTPLIQSRNANTVVVGFPMTLEDKPGTLKQDILLLRKLIQKEGIEVLLIDEALSSRKAAGYLQKRGRRAKKSDLDRTAAAIILQEYLDGHLTPLEGIDIEND